MPTFLFEELVFGPLHSRRLGNSLGINLITPTLKICNFDCVYCECGWTNFYKAKNKFADVEEFKLQLEEKMIQLIASRNEPDHITFAGNGEPTLHPRFETCVDIAIECRDEYFPKAKVAVLSNATTLNRKQVVRGLQKADLRIMKLDAGFESTFQRINKPPKGLTLDRITEQLSSWDGDLTIQTMFLKGTVDGQSLDNTAPAELKAWRERLHRIQPRSVMLYTIDRDTPIDTLLRVEAHKLNSIAEQVREDGFQVHISV